MDSTIPNPPVPDDNFTWTPNKLAVAPSPTPPPLKLQPSPDAPNLTEHASLVSASSPSDVSDDFFKRSASTDYSRDSKRIKFEETTSASGSPVKSHTRRCREKVNEKFACLLEALPAAPPGVEMKHKAQILEYAIRVFRALLERRATLRVDIALSSPAALARWAATRPLSAFAALYARKHRWPYVETWRSGALIAAHADSKSAHLRGLAACVSPQLGIVARVSASGRPEWLPRPGDDSVVFPRAIAAAQAGVELAFAVPAGHEAVLLFMDTNPRDYCTEQVSNVAQLANLVADTHAQIKQRQQAEVDAHQVLNFPSQQQNMQSLPPPPPPPCLDSLLEPFQSADMTALCL